MSVPARLRSVPVLAALIAAALPGPARAADPQAPDFRAVDLDGREVRLATLMETNTDEFYGDERGVHYATARYFCLYLQRQELLARYYREFRATVDADSTGISALERVTRRSLADFEAEWRSWVVELR